ncbi:MAG: hypothetical protein ABIJ47_06810 [Candidatus Bathyarchaeota archaeon]
MESNVRSDKNMGGAESPSGREEALTRLTGWERAFWEMLQERKTVRSAQENQAESLGGEPEPGQAVEWSTR